MKVVVTGAAGFIGSAVSLRLLQEGCEVVGVDLLDDRLYSREVKLRRLAQLQKEARFTFAHSSIGDISLTEHLRDSNAVVNEAAMPGLRLSWTDFHAYATENNIAFVGLLNQLKDLPEVHLVHASTSSVYGADAVGDENQPTLPISPYGVTKLAAEHLIAGFRKEFGLSSTILRYFSVFGPRQRPDMAYARFCDALYHRKEITVTGDGTQTRSNTYIDDIVDATFRSVKERRDGLTANVCGSESITLLEALSILADELQTEPRIRFAPRPEGDQLHTHGDARRARQDLGWSPAVPIRDGLRMQARQYWEDMR